MNETTLMIVEAMSKVGLFPGESLIQDIDDLVQSAVDDSYNGGYMDGENDSSWNDDSDYDND